MKIHKIWFALALLLAFLALQTPRAAGTDADAQTIASMHSVAPEYSVLPEYSLVHQIRQIVPWTRSGS